MKAAVLFAVAAALAGAAQSDATDAELSSASGRTVLVGTPGSGRATALPLELYVARVLAGEGEPNAPEATQQALAIAIRTYAIFNQGRHRRDGFELCDSTHCQVLRAATAASRRAALATAGRILTYQGAPAEVFYSASCGGHSESAANVWPTAALPYLRARKDDVHEEDEPWTITLKLPEIERALRRDGFEGSLADVDVVSRTESGRVARLRLTGMRPDLIAGEPFRALVGAVELRSTAFEVEKRGREMRFTGRGFGHGVGMCVVGAGRRARRGESVETILAQYYPGLAVASLAGSAVARVAVAPASTPPRPAATDLQILAARHQASLSAVLGASAAPAAVRLHETIDGFRAATGRPWWSSAAVNGSAIDLAPVTVLAQRDGLDTTLRRAIAEMLLRAALPDRPAWVTVGGGRVLAAADPPTRSAVPADRVRCPTDAELLLAVSAAAQREAEARAEACFARAYGQTRDWRTIAPDERSR